MGKNCIGIMTSVVAEGMLFINRLKAAAGKTLPGHPVFYAGVVAGSRVVLGISGMGKTNAAHAATLLMERFSPSCILNFGIGGAYLSSGLKVGDIAVAAREIYADEGVLLKDGLHSLKLTGIPLARQRGRQYFNEFPADRRLSGLVLKASRKVASARSGVFLTVSACTGTDLRAKELSERFTPLCENMEGAAVAHICCLYGIPFAEVRGISNSVGDRDRGEWDIALASENCQKAVWQFLSEGVPQHVCPGPHLGR